MWTSACTRTPRAHSTRTRGLTRLLTMKMVPFYTHCFAMCFCRRSGLKGAPARLFCPPGTYECDLGDLGRGNQASRGETTLDYLDGLYSQLPLL